MSGGDFMAEFVATTDANPVVNCERVWQWRAGFELRPFNGAIRLSCIRSFEHGKGDGSAALDWLCALADKHGVAITGDIKRVGHDGLSASNLRRWYARHGFTTMRGNINRQPKS